MNITDDAKRRPVEVSQFSLERLTVLTAESMKMSAFWNIAPYSLVDVDRRFRGAYSLHNEGDECCHLHCIVLQVVSNVSKGRR
jgi:hypothetical protein